MRPSSAGSLSSHARRSSGHHASRSAADSAIAAEREAQIDSLVKRLAEQRQVEQEIRIDIENLEAERSREAEEARSRLERAENETRSWQRQHEEATQRIQQLREERKKADEEHAEKLTAASEKSEKLERDIEVLRKELRESEVRLQNESRERAALARALHAAEDRLGSSELQASQLRADLDEICRENSELKDRYMTAGERFERLMESEEEHTKELTRQLEEEVRAAREKADRYKSKLQKSQSELEQLRDSLSREQSKTREREREVDRLMRMVEDERTAKEKTLAELSREEQIVADMRHQAAQQLDDKERFLDEQWQRRLSEKLEKQKNETSKAMDRIREGIKDLDKQKDELKRENDRLKDDKRQLQEHITTLVDKLEKVDRQRQLLEGKVDEVTDQLERNKEMYTVEMNRGLQYQGEVSRLQRVEHRQEQQVDDLKAEVLRLRQTHSDAEKILQENSRLKGEVTSLTDTVKAVEQQRVEDGKQIQALQEDLRGEKVRSSRLGQAAATAVSRLDEQVRALRPDLLALRSDASTDLARTADWITARLRELASEFGSATYLQLTRHAVMLEDVSSRLEESQNRGAKLREEVKGLRAASEQRGEELASLRSKESAARAELAAAREHIAAMVGMMDRIMKMPDGDKMGEELADALGKSGAFYPVLSRYDRRVARRVSDILQEAEDEKTRAMARVREQMDDLVIRRDELEQERSFLCEERQQLQEDLEALARDLQNICQERQLAEGDYGGATGSLREDRNVFDLLEQARASVAKLEGERKALIASSQRTEADLADLQLLKDNSRAELAAARENMTGMLRMMDRIIESPENENLRRELREALGDSHSFRAALARYAEEITERISTIRREAQAGVKPVAAHSNSERESQWGEIELELEHQTSMRSGSETAATQHSVEVQAALGRETVSEDRCLDEKVEDERSGFDGEMSTALEHTKDAFRVEIGRLESEVVQLKRLFEQELRRVKNEAELRLENFKQHTEEQRVEERSRTALKLEDVAREKEQLEMDKFRLQNSLDVAQRKLSELGSKNSPLVNGDPVVTEIDPLVFADRNTYRIGRIGKLRSPIASSGRRIPAGKESEAPLAMGSPSPSLPGESFGLSTICSTTQSPAKDRRRPSRRLQPSSSCLASTTVDPKHRCKAFVAESAQLNFEDGSEPARL